MNINRRTFIKTSAVASLAFPHIHVNSQTKKYRTALIGSGWWGMNILRTAIAAGESKTIAMCDVDDNQLNPAVAEVEKLSGDEPKKNKDYRELLEREKPVIVIVVKLDHWHPLITIATVRAGEHVDGE